MRRADREVTERAEIDAILNAALVCRLAFALGDEPYLVPLSFGYDGTSLYFHTAASGKKVDCIAANPRVCFEVEHNVRLVTHPKRACGWSFSFESVVGYGVVRELRSAADKERGLRRVVEHYGGGGTTFSAEATARTRVWRLDVQSLGGKRA